MGESDGSTIVILIVMLILIGGGGAYYWFVYRCKSESWNSSKDLMAVPNDTESIDMDVSVCTAKANAISKNSPAFWLVSNSSGKFDAYYYAPSSPGTLTITLRNGKDTLYTSKTNKITLQSSSSTTSPVSGITSSVPAVQGRSTSSPASSSSSPASSSSSPPSSSSSSQPATIRIIDNLILTEPTSIPWGDNGKPTFRKELLKRCSNLKQGRVNALTDKEVYDMLVDNTCSIAGPTCTSAWEFHNTCADQYTKNDCENTEVLTGLTHQESGEDSEGVWRLHTEWDTDHCRWS